MAPYCPALAGNTIAFRIVNQLAVNENDAELQVFLESDLTDTEWTERQADELAIELAGKDRLEKALIIGEKLSHIYNSGSFRRSAPGGERWTWEQYVNNRLPELLPGEAPKITQADCRRFLWETRKLVAGRTSGQGLPTTTGQAEALQALIPRRYSGPSGWNPAVLNDPEQAKGLRLVWEKALERAQQQQRRNGPTADDVRIVREEWRTQLELTGQIRQAPKAFQQVAADRAAQAAANAARPKHAQHTAQPTIDVTPIPDQVSSDQLREMLASTEAERKQRVNTKEVKDELSKADREALADLQRYHKLYADALAEAVNALAELRRALNTISTVKGTIYLDELREYKGPLGFNLIANDMKELQRAKDLLLEIVKVATSRTGPQSIDWETVDAEVI